MKKIIILIATVAIGGAILAQKSQNASRFSLKTALSGKSTETDVVSGLSFGGTDTRIEAAPTVKEWDEMMKVSADLQYKVIRTAEDQARLVRMYGSRRNIDEATERVENWDASNLASNQDVRMQSILFFMRAMELKDNPERSYLEQAISKMVLDPKLSAISDRDLKRSVIADRMELFAILKEKSPLVAARVQETAPSELHKKVMQYAVRFYNLDKKEN